MFCPTIVDFGQVYPKHRAWSHRVVPTIAEKTFIYSIEKCD